MASINHAVTTHQQDPHTDLLNALSFVEKEPTQGLPRSFWQVTPTSNYGADCLAGNTMARELLQHLITCINSPDYGGNERHLLGNIALSMAGNDLEANGMVVGFFYELTRQIEPLLKSAQFRH